METIRDVRLETVEESQWINIKQVIYKQNGVRKRQEITCSHDTCGILIHNASRDVFVFVRQFRPAVFMHEVGWQSLLINCKGCVNPAPEQLEKGFTLELCAGIIDKEGKSVNEIAAEEVLEECGYRIEPDKLEHILATRNNSLHSGTLQHLFYARVTDEMKAEGWGGGNRQEGEFIEVIESKVDDLLNSIFEDTLPKPIGLTFAIIWFLLNKTPSSRHSSSASKPKSDSLRFVVQDPAGSLDSAEKKKKNLERLDRRPLTQKSKADGGIDPYNCANTRLVVTDVQVADKRSCQELQIYRLHFKQMNLARSWDFFYVRSVCATLVHNVTRNVFVLVRKFSPAVYGSMHRRACGSKEIKPSEACLNQLCSTSYERGVHPCPAAAENIRKMLGYKVSSKEFKKIIKSRSNVGIAGAILTLFYVTVTDEMKQRDWEGSGKPEDVEYDIIEVPVTSDDVTVMTGSEMLMMQERNPMSLSLALLWYYYRRQSFASPKL